MNKQNTEVANNTAKGCKIGGARIPVLCAMFLLLGAGVSCAATIAPAPPVQPVSLYTYSTDGIATEVPQLGNDGLSGSASSPAAPMLSAEGIFADAGVLATTATPNISVSLSLGSISPLMLFGGGAAGQIGGKSGGGFVSPTSNTVAEAPEPSTWLLIGLGMAGIGRLRRATTR